MKIEYSFVKCICSPRKLLFWMFPRNFLKSAKSGSFRVVYQVRAQTYTNPQLMSASLSPHAHLVYCHFESTKTPNLAVGNFFSACFYFFRCYPSRCLEYVELSNTQLLFHPKETWNISIWKSYFQLLDLIIFRIMIAFS